MNKKKQQQKYVDEYLRKEKEKYDECMEESREHLVEIIKKIYRSGGLPPPEEGQTKVKREHLRDVMRGQFGKEHVL